MDSSITKRVTPLPHPESGAIDAIAHQLRITTPAHSATARVAPRQTIGEAAKSVGAWEDRYGNVCFRSWDAVRAFAMKMQRDMVLAQVVGGAE